jgi:hypothetical protein
MITGKCRCGEVTFEFNATVSGVTACNCNVCRRYGALWAYGHLDQEVRVSGDTSVFLKGDTCEFHFCKSCGCVVYYLGNPLESNGLQKAVVNLRMADDPDQVKDLPIDHFDGLDTFEDLPRDGRLVKDLWF